MLENLLEQQAGNKLEGCLQGNVIVGIVLANEEIDNLVTDSRVSDRFNRSTWVHQQGGVFNESSSRLHTDNKYNNKADYHLFSVSS